MEFHYMIITRRTFECIYLCTYIVVGNFCSMFGICYQVLEENELINAIASRITCCDFFNQIIQFIHNKNRTLHGIKVFLSICNINLYYMYV